MYKFGAFVFLIICLSWHILHAKEEGVATAIDIQNLDPISIDSLGIYDKNNGGMKEDIWINSNDVTVLYLLDKITETIKSETIDKLLHKLLISETDTPKITNNENNGLFLKLRLKALLVQNKANDVSRLIEMIPAESKDEYLNQIYVEALVKTNLTNDACKSYVAMQRSPEAGSFWDVMRIICYSYYGDKAKTELSIATLQETKKDLAITLSEMLANVTQDNFYDHTDKIFNFLKQQNLLAIKAPLPSANNIGKWYGTLDPNLQYVIRSFQYVKDDNIFKLYRFLRNANITIPVDDYNRLFTIKDKFSENFILDNISNCAKNNLNGELILWLAILFSEKQPGEFDNNIISQVIIALNNSGLDKEAQELIIEAMNNE